MESFFNDRKWISLARRYKLNPREVEAAKLMCQGLSYKEIAKDLGIMVTTLKRYVYLLFTKVGVHNKISLFRTFVGNEEFLRADEEWAHLAKLYQFTPRELEIAKRISQGLLYKQVASSLYIELSTVKSHVYHLFAKVRERDKMSLFLRFVEDTKFLRSETLV